jgi:YVTN family beta-propeller protein
VNVGNSVGVHNRTLEVLVDQELNLERKPYLLAGNGPEDLVMAENERYSLSSPYKKMDISNFFSDTISIINPELYPIINYVNVGEFAGEHLLDNKLYVANSDSGTVSVIDGNTNIKTKDIKVGENPSVLEIYNLGNKLYVANSDSGTVSVIDTTTDKVIKNITVGGWPGDILSLSNERLYLANSDTDNVSVIDTTTDKVIKNITVGHSQAIFAPSMINEKLYVASSDSSGLLSVINTKTYEVKDIVVIDYIYDLAILNGKLYVASIESNNVSVIDTTTDKVIKNITVGSGSVDLETDYLSDKLYVANLNSGTVSVIDTTTDKVIKNIEFNKSIDQMYLWEDTLYVLGYNEIYVVDTLVNKLVAGVIINTEPENSGTIKCLDDLSVPLKEYLYIHSDVECVAIPNKGFEFVSWNENLNSNITKTIKVSQSNNYFLKPFFNLFGLSSADPSAELNVTQFGNFTANFRELPPTIPSEYWIPLYGIIASTIVGWSIPSIIGWTKLKSDVKKLNHYHKKIKSLYDDGNLDENDLRSLDDLKNKITDEYAKGKINELHYNNLKSEISLLYDKIFRKKLESRISTSDIKTTKEYLNEMKHRIEITYSEGKINELHYNILNKIVQEQLDEANNI